VEILARYWWLNLIRGLLALALGILMFSWPAIFTILVLVMFFSAYALVDGIISIVASFAHPKTPHRWWLFAGGIIGILAAIVIFSQPALATVFLLYFIAFWALFTGIFEIIYAAAQWKTLPGKGWLLVGGILSILIGIMLLSNPIAMVLALIWAIALYLVLFGIVLIMWAFILLGKGKKPAQVASA
jgi:uncharacterized membrane protein HdeD (DUF308 family)